MKKIIFLLVLSTVISYAQWQPDVRLTSSPGNSYTSRNGWCIAASGVNVHAIWEDFRNGNYEIYYKGSTDNGITWGTDIRLTNNTGQSENPSISVSASDVQVVWQDDRDGGNYEIYFKRSSDGGLTWGADTRLTNNVEYSEFPVVSVLGSTVHVVWYDIRDLNREIYYKRSTDGGITWGADTRLTTNTAVSWFASIAVSGSFVHVVWQDYRDANFEIYYKRSTDGGLTWGADTRLTNSPDYSEHASVSVSGSVVHVVWEDSRDGDYEIYYKRSTDGGITWGTDTRLTVSPSLSNYSSVSVSGSVVHVVWEDFRDNGFEIYYKRSTDGGVSWGTDTRITNDPAGSQYPSVAVSGSVVHVIWNDYRDLNWEIYYKRDPTGNPLGLININSEIPKVFSLSQNYPNPFNPETNIKFSILKSGNVRLTIFDIAGREVETLVNQNMNAGTFNVDWDATNYSSGVYFYMIETEDFREIKKMLLVK